MMSIVIMNDNDNDEGSYLIVSQFSRAEVGWSSSLSKEDSSLSSSMLIESGSEMIISD